MFNKPQFAKNGFTFLEVIVAVFIISVGVVGVVKIMPSLLSISALNNSRLAAAYLAQEGIEIVRNIRDSNFLAASAWDQYLDACSSGCEADYTDAQSPSLSLYGTGNYLNIDSAGFYSYSAGTPTKFKRRITITPEGADILKVAVDVYWQERVSSYVFSAQEKIYKWY